MNNKLYTYSQFILYQNPMPPQHFTTSQKTIPTSPTIQLMDDNYPITERLLPITPKHCAIELIPSLSISKETNDCTKAPPPSQPPKDTGSIPDDRSLKTRSRVI